jgi:hypothetical protein
MRGEYVVKRKGGTMSVRLRKETQRSGICIHDMKDGDIGEVVGWPVGCYIGRIVQRYGKCLLVIGSQSGDGWGPIFDAPRNEDRRVRILEPGEILEITT